jgi:glycosyltransferase involved in cell wall biosynthesis
MFMERHNEPARILRLIARMNLGGPAHHVTVLSSRLDQRMYETLLVTGRVGRGEEEHIAPEVRIRYLPSLGPDIRPREDLRALLTLIRLIRAYRPDIVETHTSKAGLLGRVAAVLALPRRPIVIHTYHGHVLRGYFGPAKTRAFTLLERALNRVSDLLVVVSSKTADELIELKVARRSKFAVVPLGLELDGFLALAPEPDPAARARLGVAPEEIVFTITGRLVPIKRLDLALRSLAIANRSAPMRLLVVGDGDLRPELERLAAELGCADQVDFLGYRRDLETIAAASDAALLTSDNEGTPVALIEAAAAARPVVATDVGGVADVVADGETGLLARRDDVEAIAAAMVRLAGDRELRLRAGKAGRARVRRRFMPERLVADMEEIYSRLLATGRS